jgi:outer membrane protein assembly factor BamB
MPNEQKCKGALRLRLATLLFPPAGLTLLWLGPYRLGKKFFGTLGILLYCLPYSALIIWLLLRFTTLQVEWRGGFPPVLTYSKTLPDYEAVEKHRTRQTRLTPSIATPAPKSQPAYWTDFRGPKRDGHYDELPINTNWPANGLPQLWRQPIGGGYASFTIAEGLAFTIEQRRDNEVVTAYNLQTGREIWTNGWTASFQESMGGDGPRATPTYHAGKIYALGAEGELRCLEASTGKRIWSKNILADNDAANIAYGMAASPLIVDDKVIVQPGGLGGKSVVAYDKLTGKPLWKSLNDPAAYSSPMLVNLAGQRQLLIVTATRVVGLEIETGKLLWEHPWVVKLDNRNIAQPLILNSNRFFLSAGYGTGCQAVEITRSDSHYSARTLWQNKFLKNKFTSSVFWNGFIYGLDEDILTCLDAQTGERKWKDGRYGYGQILLASGHLIILSGEGELALVKAIPERHEELARFPAIHGKTWNHPAIAGGKLLVRNAVEMACFDLSGK